MIVTEEKEAVYLAGIYAEELATGITSGCLAPSLVG